MIAKKNMKYEKSEQNQITFQSKIFLKKQIMMLIIMKLVKNKIVFSINKIKREKKKK